MDQSQVNEITEKSVNMFAISIGLAYKWQKKNLTEKIEEWARDFAKSMSEEEKKEYLEVMDKLKLL